MNLENVRKLRDRLVNYRDNGQSRSFNMSTYIFSHDIEKKGEANVLRDLLDPKKAHACGTYACMAGFAAAINQEEQGKTYHTEMVAEEARLWLGLSEREAEYWFLGWWADWDYLSNISIQEAIDFLNKRIDTKTAIAPL